MGEELAQVQAWISRLKNGEADALGALLEYYRPRLRQMVRLWLDPQLTVRVDPSDIIQETYLDAKRQLRRYLHEPNVLFYVWLRGLAQQRIANAARHHRQTQARSVAREEFLSDQSSELLARRLLSKGASASETLNRKEVCRRVREAMGRLSPSDHEVILMRHFEELSNREVAQTLSLSESGATMRYGRALFRLKEILAEDPLIGGGLK
jgi:RNA polymerase sigma-70 factor, ECF subfamily